MKKREPIILENIEITGVADKGRGVGRLADGRVVFVEHVALGDIVDARIVKKKPEFLEAYAIHYHKLSEDRVEPFCEHFSACGGCRWQHVNYSAQIHNKEQVVRDAISRIAKTEPFEFLPIIPCAETVFYRNKLEFAFSNKKWLGKDEHDAGLSNEQDVLGFHRPGAFDKIVDINKCWLQPDPSNEIRLKVKAITTSQGLSYFDLREQKGFMRHIMIRSSTLGEVMLIVSFHSQKKSKIKKLLDDIISQVPQLTSVYYCVNPKQNDYVLDLEMIHYSGKPFIEEQLGHVRFRIGPKSFFQTNSKQAKVLYDKVVEFAGLTGLETVYDLYTGVGSIALYLAKFSKNVVGIEEVPEAITDANENAKLNRIENCIFYAGDVKKVLSPEFTQLHGKADIVITDPPRAGMHGEVINFFLHLEAPKIVYVSCNPSTQARDIALLNEKYDLIKIQPVDMFPHTHHIETVALLKLRQS